MTRFESFAELEEYVLKHDNFMSLPFESWCNDAMTPAIRNRLLGPSSPDNVEFRLGKCRWEAEYLERGVTKERNALEDNKAVKGMIACALQSFMAGLTDGEELTGAFHEPAKANLSESKKLAIGMMREVFIIPRFDSMSNFWKVHQRMVAEGGKSLGLYSKERFGPSKVKDLLAGEPEIIAMYDLLADLGMQMSDFGLDF